jgi:phosphatidate cytidylyltransferase
MSLQDATEGSDSRKNKRVVRNLIPSVFRFEHTGSLKDRLVTAIVVLYVALALSLLAIYLPYGRLICVAWTAAIAAVSTFEVVRLFARHHDTLHYRPVAGAIAYAILILPAVAATISAVGSVFGDSTQWHLVYGALIASGQLLMVAQVFEGRRRLEDAARHSECYGSSFFILAVCAPQLIIIGASSHGVQLLWWIAALAALNDAAAYFVGRALGKHKMAPGLSPNKSLEGSIAGLVVGTVAGIFFWRALLGETVGLWQLLVLSLTATVAAQAGDLAKSYLKRLRGVKDLGAFFPGHGGVLDRFDAMIAVAPVLVVGLSLLGLL